MMILAASIYSTLFNNKWTTFLTIIMVAVELYLLYSFYPALWSGWQVLIIPISTVLASVINRLREVNFESVLGWAETSTKSALIHIEEVREHRAQLFRSVKDLNDAYHRLERANTMLIEARTEAEKAHQAQKQFALTISHELRTPLSFIIGFSEVMVNSPQVYGELSSWPDGLYEDIKDIFHSSQHLLTLVNDVLDLGKVDANRMLLMKETLSPETIVKEAQAILKEAVESKGLWLQSEFDPDLPDIYIDRTRIRQVLLNLMNNSLRFTEKGGITVSVTKQVDGILFTVRDTGSGIPESDIPKVFEEFGQVNATIWRRRDGTGLGVPISQRFVEMHGGRIWLESIEGQGTSVFFTIPLPGEVNWPRWLAEPESGDYWKFKEKENKSSQLILVFSPDPGSAKVLENILEGYQVASIVDFKKPVQQIEQLLPQALIIDQAIQNQPEVTQLIRDLPYDLPVLILPLPGNLGMVHNLPDGIVDYLPKPVLREDLLNAFHRLEKTVRRLWIIDDDEAMIRFVHLAFASSSFSEPPEIQATHCGNNAIQQLTQEDSVFKNDAPPDAILLDLGLPDMTGWDLLPQLKEYFSRAGLPLPPIILFTAALLSEELEARSRKIIQVSTVHPLSTDNLGAVVRGILQVIHPRFISYRNGQAQPETPVEKKVF
jgi:signal transduction histidine kinase/CheY-like chemotaxis protein